MIATQQYVRDVKTQVQTSEGCIQCLKQVTRSCDRLVTLLNKRGDRSEKDLMQMYAIISQITLIVRPLVDKLASLTKYDSCCLISLQILWEKTPDFPSVIIPRLVEEFKKFEKRSGAKPETSRIWRIQFNNMVKELEHVKRLFPSLGSDAESMREEFDLNSTSLPFDVFKKYIRVFKRWDYTEDIKYMYKWGRLESCRQVVNGILVGGVVLAIGFISYQWQNS